MNRSADRIRILEGLFLICSLVNFFLPELSIRQENYPEQTFSQFSFFRDYFLSGSGVLRIPVSGNMRILTILCILIPVILALLLSIGSFIDKIANKYIAIGGITVGVLYFLHLLLAKSIWPKRLNDAQSYDRRIGWWLLAIVMLGILLSAILLFVASVQKTEIEREVYKFEPESGAAMNTFRQERHSRISPQSGFSGNTEPLQPYYLKQGTVLGEHFVVETVIGAGNYGITYQCYDTTLGVHVAVKEFFPDGFVARAEGEKRVQPLIQNQGHRYREMLQHFMMEARSIARFGEANDIVNVYDYFEENNTAYIIMEYVNAILLQDYLERKGRIDPQLAVQIVDSILEAVKKLHARGIIHQDISPDNIFILEDESIKLFDFGSASFKESEAVGEKVIKPGYSAPELYQNWEYDPSYHTDIYSIGAILYHMVTGMRPLEAGRRIRNDRLQSPREMGADIDRGLDRAIMEAMALRPDLRCKGIPDFEDALHGKRYAEYPEEKIQRQKRTRTWLVLVSVLAVIAVAVGVGLIYNMTRGTENIMFDTVVEPDRLTIWVDSSGLKDTLQEVVVQMQNATAGDSSVIQRVKKENMQITYDIIDVTEQGKTMEQALQEAAGTQEFPTVFVSDRVSNLKDYSLLSYQDNVCKSLDDTTHLYLSGYEDKYASWQEMPTSFDVMLCYVIGSADRSSIWFLEGSSKSGILISEQEKMKKGRILMSSLIGEQEADGTIDFQKIVQANSEGREYTYLGSEALKQEKTTNAKGKTSCLESTEEGWETAAKLALLLEDTGFQLKEGKFDFNSNYIGRMSNLAEMSLAAQQKYKWKLSDDQKATDYLYGNSILAGSGYQSVLSEAKVGNSNIPYEIYVPTVNGKMLVTHSGKLAISAEVSENKQVAAMRFVYFALEQQHSNSVQNTTYPLSLAEGMENNSFLSFFEVNSAHIYVRDLIWKKSYPCMLIGSGTGNIRSFAKGLWNEKQKQEMIDKETLEAYCKEYQTMQK